GSRQGDESHCYGISSIRNRLPKWNCEDDDHFRADFFDGRFDRQWTCALTIEQGAPISIGAIFWARAGKKFLSGRVTELKRDAPGKPRRPHGCARLRLADTRKCAQSGCAPTASAGVTEYGSEGET